MSESRFNAMGTAVHLVVTGLGCADAAAALADARALIEEAEARLSRFRETSELSHLNRSAGDPTIVSTRTMTLLLAAQRAWRETNGAFDPTLGAELRTLGYTADFDEIHGEGAPDRAAAPERAAAPGRSERVSLAGEISLDPVSNMAIVPEGVQLDLGGIAKGATADDVAERLMNLGAEGCCVNIGGDLRVCGTGPDQGSWTVGLPCPGTDETRTFRLSDGAVATSSTSKRRWRSTYGPVHHLLDPGTGVSRTTGPTTVSVVAATATAAEVISKWMMGGGAAAHFDATGFAIDATGQIFHEPGLDAFLAGSPA